MLNGERLISVIISPWHSLEHPGPSLFRTSEALHQKNILESC